ncbi:hypothetical protein CBG25_08935 [Arsenophonus sp. ENCA]|uniref:GFA family protein n=2 Tax=Arsenophonus sp. ENCA TaxID=1987579 RepID=UPI000BD51C07|nr:GFA family protein [Arsenophonus sp. ENCA]PAV02775.1 hypothetical protein CBG25_08935 [Arsenophonus sp. ENCA]
MQYEDQSLYEPVILKTEQPCYEISVCNCMICQKWNGDLLMTFIVENGLSIEGKYYVSYCRYSIWLMRIFFHKYGTHLFSKMLKPESYYANAVLFEKSKMGFLVTQFYVGCNPLHYNLIEKTALFTEQHILNT